MLAADGGRLDLSQPMLFVLFDGHLVADALGGLKETQAAVRVRPSPPFPTGTSSAARPSRTKSSPSHLQVALAQLAESRKAYNVTKPVEDGEVIRGSREAPTAGVILEVGGRLKQVRFPRLHHTASAATVFLPRVRVFPAATSGRQRQGGNVRAAKEVSSPLHAALRYAWRASAKLSDHSASEARSG